jgi:hypothetical protein
MGIATTERADPLPPVYRFSSRQKSSFQPLFWDCRQRDHRHLDKTIIEQLLQLSNICAQRGTKKMPNHEHFI